MTEPRGGKAETPVGCTWKHAGWLTLLFKLHGCFIESIAVWLGMRESILQSCKGRLKKHGMATDGGFGGEDRDA